VTFPEPDSMEWGETEAMSRSGWDFCWKRGEIEDGSACNWKDGGKVDVDGAVMKWRRRDDVEVVGWERWQMQGEMVEYASKMQ